MRAKPRQVRRRIGLWSNRGYAKLDGRLLEAREEKRLIAMLAEHVGRPNPAQMLLIERCARSLLMVSQLERRLIELGELSDIGARQVVALSNNVRLNLQALGLSRPDVQIAAPLEYLAAKRKSAA